MVHLGKSCILSLVLKVLLTDAIIEYYSSSIRFGLAPQYLSNCLPPQNAALVNLRSRPAIYPMEARTESYRNYFFSFSPISVE